MESISPYWECAYEQLRLSARQKGISHMNKVYPTNRALNMLPEYKSIFIGKFLFLWNNTLYINTASIFHRTKVNQQSFHFSFSISLLFLKLLRTEPVGVKSSFTSDIFLSVFILYSLCDVFVHSQINISKLWPWHGLQPQCSLWG